MSIKPRRSITDLDLIPFSLTSTNTSMTLILHVYLFATEQRFLYALLKLHENQNNKR